MIIDEKSPDPNAGDDHADDGADERAIEKLIRELEAELERDAIGESLRRSIEARILKLMHRQRQIQESLFVDDGSVDPPEGSP